MASKSEIARRAQAEIEIRRRLEREELSFLWDWYGDECGCRHHDGRCPRHPGQDCGCAKRLGECHDHPRARPGQRPPGSYRSSSCESDWRIWMIRGGRGYGKSLAASRYINSRVQDGTVQWVALIGATVGDVREFQIEHPYSGLLKTSPPWFKAKYIPSKARVEWPNGAYATIFTAEEPEGLRGGGFNLAWADELAKWQHKQQYTWDMLEFTLRELTEPRPQVVVTTTPRPTPTYFQVRDGRKTVVTGGTIYENACNLDPDYIDDMRRKYEGTHLGRTELLAEDDIAVPGALWNRQEMIDPYRVRAVPEFMTMNRVVVGVDPNAGAGDLESGAECGIVAGCRASDDRGYTLGDFSCNGSPETWGKAALTAYKSLQADLIVVEKNNGGEMVEHVLRSIRATPDDPWADGRHVNIKTVWASRGKAEGLNNSIITTKGWKKFRDLTDRDFVFDHIGRPAPITALPIHRAAAAVVTFSDGSSGIYAMEHEWRVLNHATVRTFVRRTNAAEDWARWRSAGKGGYTRTLTNEMKEQARQFRLDGLSWSEVSRRMNASVGSLRSALAYQKSESTCAEFKEMTTADMFTEMRSGESFMIPCPPPLQFEGTSHIDPYLLGLWIGDGSVGHAALTSKTPDDDDKIESELIRRGFKITRRNGVLYVNDMRWAFAGRKHKEIHEDEWMVNPMERLDLIRGLIDSDGTKKSESSIAFSQSGYRRKTVIRPAMDAMRSMGWTVNEPHHKETYREPAETITIRPAILDCSLLPRKNITSVHHGSRYRSIASIVPIGETDVRCITVHSDDHLYLSGRSMIATHNSVRAEPVSALYEQGRISHVGEYSALELQMCSFIPGDPPETKLDRMDALVWMYTELFLEGGYESGFIAVGGNRNLGAAQPRAAFVHMRR